MAVESRLIILGTHISNDAYPNVRYKVRALLALPNTEEINVPASTERLFARSCSRLGRIGTLLRSAFRFVTAHLHVILAYLRRPTPDAIYVPYPSVFVLWLLSWLPRSRRAGLIVADAFISLYDTISVDRRLLSPGGVAARLLHLCERRAYRFADRVVVDTKLNAEYLSRLFTLPPHKMKPLPLSIDETAYAPNPYEPNATCCRILFTGTFVPLQGVDTIANAINLLANRRDIHIRLIGDGQSARQVEEILGHASDRNWSWSRDWYSASMLAAEIRSADICLGIFGASDKTQRVWPLKNYAYMAVGRALITADTAYARQLAEMSNEMPFVRVRPADPYELAAAIGDLATDAARRQRLAVAGRACYQQHLCAEISARQLRTLLTNRLDRDRNGGAKHGY